MRIERHTWRVRVRKYTLRAYPKPKLSNYERTHEAVMTLQAGSRV